MTQYSCVIIDNNPSFSGILTELISQHDESKLLFTVRDASDLPLVSEQVVDVVFYDPDVLGDSTDLFLDKLPGNPQRVIISSDEEYAIQALMSDVTDFLEKSILTSDRFDQTISLVKSNANERVVTVEH